MRIVHFMECLMDLRQLEYFTHVAELGSFTRAANFLLMTQPVLSRQVRSLEIEFRQVLLERNGRGVVMTEAGKRLLAHSRSILGQAARIRSDMEDGRGKATGRLVVALPPSVSLALTAPLVRLFRQSFPKASLCILEGISAYALEWLAIGRVDCAVVYTVAPSQEIELSPVLSEQLYLISKRSTQHASGKIMDDEPAAWPEVAQCQLILPSRPHSIRMLLESSMAEASLRPQVALEIESVPAILNLVRDEGLTAVLSLKALCSTGQENEFDARPIGTPPLQTTLWVATSARRPSGQLLKQTVPLLHQVLCDTWHTPALLADETTVAPD
jgi:LysR family nitrogen assimilation transcriptional regulator